MFHGNKKQARLGLVRVFYVGYVGVGVGVRTGLGGEDKSDGPSVDKSPPHWVQYILGKGIMIFNVPYLGLLVYMVG